MSVLFPRQHRIQHKTVQLLRYEQELHGMWVAIEQMWNRIGCSDLRDVTQVEILGVAWPAQKGGGLHRFNAVQDEHGWWIALDLGSEQEQAARVEGRGKKRGRG